MPISPSQLALILEQKIRPSSWPDNWQDIFNTNPSLALAQCLLGNPSPSELTTRYRSLAKKYHPDKGGQARWIAAINAAFARMKDGRPDQAPHKDEEPEEEYNEYGEFLHFGWAASKNNSENVCKWYRGSLITIFWYDGQRYRNDSGYKWSISRNGHVEFSHEAYQTENSAIHSAWTEV